MALEQQVEIEFEQLLDLYRRSASIAKKHPDAVGTSSDKDIDDYVNSILEFYDL